jgi:dTDP-4-amino-4,6-dideoxygalactose transaminase
MNDVSAMPRPIAFVDLSRQQDRIRGRIDAAIARVLNHGQYVMGPEVAELERRLAAFCGVRHAISCASGTDALLLALMAKGLHPGEGVIVPSFTFSATAEVVCLLGAVPIFADVDATTCNLDPGSLKEALVAASLLGLRVRGVISVDLFGQPCDYDAIEELAREYGLWVICDAAQSFGAAYRGRKVGALGDVTATSFFPAKPLGCYGDGGAVFTDDDALAEIVRSLRVHGQGKDKYDNVRVGINGRLDTLQAAILLQKLEVFDEEIAARAVIAARYGDMLPAGCAPLAVLDGASPVWALYTIRATNRDERLSRLQWHGIPAMIYYRCPVHLQPAYAGFPRANDALPTSTRLAETAISLPMHPYLSAEEQARIVAALGGNSD